MHRITAPHYSPWFHPEVQKPQREGGRDEREQRRKHSEETQGNKMTDTKIYRADKKKKKKKRVK